MLIGIISFIVSFIAIYISYMKANEIKPLTWEEDPSVYYYTDSSRNLYSIDRNEFIERLGIVYRNLSGGIRFDTLRNVTTPYDWNHIPATSTITHLETWLMIAPHVAKQGVDIGSLDHLIQLSNQIDLSTDHRTNAPI